mmetsp:Transcript_31131/g.54711  ORF Transcript_31131/g.54711 Transcript_31131/m.54711 type:complete len:245 (+) Transcript_31131:524-1258(+)
MAAGDVAAHEHQSHEDRADGERAQQLAARLGHDEREEESADALHDVGREGLQLGVEARRRVLCEEEFLAVGRPEEERREPPAQHRAQPVDPDVPERALADGEACAHGGVERAARDVADAQGPREHGEADRQPEERVVGALGVAGDVEDHFGEDEREQNLAQQRRQLPVLSYGGVARFDALCLRDDAAHQPRQEGGGDLRDHVEAGGSPRDFAAEGHGESHSRVVVCAADFAAHEHHCHQNPSHS